ncbi:MliC family protein [Rouxiella badensis]|uniref:MliC family protein n=1 Tax=Rouxiella badensis TaxID=1646377 RepID=UPI001B690E6B|nr:MliC family protein [Rouxiella badensis]MCC3746120.1 MliC family protein [Rouxiella badensis]
MKKAILVGLTSVVLAGCSQFSHQSASDAAPDSVQLHYECGTTPLSVTLNKPARQVSLILDGIQLHLPQVEAASGTRYSDGHYTFWSKGNAALVQRGDDVIIDDCVIVPAN